MKYYIIKAFISFSLGLLFITGHVYTYGWGEVLFKVMGWYSVLTSPIILYYQIVIFKKEERQKMIDEFIEQE